MKKVAGFNGITLEEYNNRRAAAITDMREASLDGNVSVNRQSGRTTRLMLDFLIKVSERPGIDVLITSPVSERVAVGLANKLEDLAVRANIPLPKNIYARGPQDTNLPDGEFIEFVDHGA